MALPPSAGDCRAVLLSLLFLLPAAHVRAADRQTINTHIAGVTSRLQPVRRLPATERLQLAIGLPLRNQTGLTNLLHELYRPGSPNFHHYLRPDQFRDQFGPTEQDYLRVQDCARSNHLKIVGTFDNRALVDVAGTVADIEGMFHVHLSAYRHPAENREFYAPDAEPSVDAALPISHVVGLNNYTPPQPRVSTSVRGARKEQADVFNGSGTNNYYLGNDFRNAYVPGSSLQGAGQVVGLFEFVGYNPSDITEYETLAGLPSVPLQNVVMSGASGLPDSSNNHNFEIALDIEMVIAMAPRLKEVLVVEAYTGVDAMNQLASTNNGAPLPNQVSSSWGFSEATACEPALMQMAAQGQSFFLASGDTGAPANGVQSFAADDNYATMVGGTELSMSNNSSNWQAEQVWDYQWATGASTGYVETDLAIPDYQLGINTSANGGSTAYRNVPDVAMCADYIEIVTTQAFTNKPNQSGVVTGVGGTSAAAPLWAAFTALVNEQAANQGAPPAGFINPSLYAIANGPLYTSCFHDVTVGNNTNTNSGNLFYAGPGYDNCTGLGTPNGSNLINALAGYAGPIFVNFNYTGSLSSQNGSYYTPYNTLTQGVNAAPNYATIIIENAGSSAETLSINKPLNIIASDGPAIIGQ